MSYVERYIYGYNEDGDPQYTTTTHNTGAKVTGTVASNSNKFTVNGVPVACVGDLTQEQWVADPFPLAQRGGNIISISPGTSGQGRITTGNGARVTLNGKLIAVQGSTIQTYLGSDTTIEEGDSLINM